MSTTYRKPIYETPLHLLAGSENVFDITTSATPCRYRLIDCDRFITQQVLCIEEFSNFPNVQFTAISYVWRGNAVDPVNITETFIVKGAEDADPISIDVLNHACTASIHQAINYIWLDRLCIIQTNHDDKAWQIGHMYRIYQTCTRCIVLPGGLQRLVRLDEETGWIHRGWTLQEALAPRDVRILFAWKLGPGTGTFGDARGVVDEVIPQQSAIASLMDILNACSVGQMAFARTTSRGESESFIVETIIFGFKSPHLAALAVTLTKELTSGPDTRDHAIWRSALMRTSSRPVDMVFSIMGLFGISLDTKAFHKNDRLGATIALAREILRGGGRASWLGASLHLPPCNELSTFPIFPQTSVTGKALVRTPVGSLEMGEMMTSEYYNCLALGMLMPEGSMDDTGYLTFTRRAFDVVRQYQKEPDHLDIRTSTHKICTAINGSHWKFYEPVEAPTDTQDHARSFAVLLGWFDEHYPGATIINNKRKIKAMLIMEHAPKKYHVVTFFEFDMGLEEWVQAWKEYTFSVGGPHVPNRDPSAKQVVQVVHNAHLLTSPARSFKWAASLFSQKSIENYYSRKANAQ